MYRTLCLTGFALAALLAPAPVSAATTTHVVPASQLQTLDTLFLNLDAQLKDKRYEEVRLSLQAIIAHPQFGELTSETKIACYRLLASEQLGIDMPQPAYDNLLKAAAFGDAGLDADYWELRVHAAGELRKSKEGVGDFTTLITRFPEKLKEYESDYVFSFIYMSADIDDRTSQKKLLEALYAVGYGPRDFPYSAEWVYFDLFEIYVTEKAEDKASAIAATLIEPETILRFRIDKRYAAYRRVTDAELASAFEAQLGRHRDFMAKNPRLLSGPSAVASDLDNLARSEAGLKIIDEALARIANAPTDSPAYDDLADQHNWALNARYRLLKNLGRYAEAEQALKEGRDAGIASGEDLVSQKINLGGFYNVLSRPQDALKEVADIKPEDVSLYGLMSAEEVRACAYAQTGDTAKLRASLDLMLTNAKDAYWPLEAALLCAGDSAALARLIIDRLEDPETRANALVSVQTYLPVPHPTPAETAREATHRKTLARADVRAAILKYGEIVSLPVRRFPY